MDKKIIYINSLVIAVLAMIATVCGLFWKGLYQKDSVSIIAQMMGQDLITLIIVIPILLISLYLITKNSLRGRLIWMGTIFYFTYTYCSMSFAASFNQLFLVYVTIFSLSIYTFLGELVSLDVDQIKENFSQGTISKITAAFLIIMGLLLAGMWLSIIVNFLLTGIYPAAMENMYTTLVIQAMDLAIVVPAAFLTGYLLLKKRSWGYVLASIFLVKVSLLGTAILSMIFFMMGSGVEVASGQVIFFVMVTIGGILIAIAFYNNIKGTLSSGFLQ